VELPLEFQEALAFFLGELRDGIPVWRLTTSAMSSALTSATD
jgi:hypothetical protein